MAQKGPGGKNSWIRRKIMSAVTTGTSEEIDLSGYRNACIAVVGSAGISAGAIVFEQSPEGGRSETWQSVHTAPGISASAIAFSTWGTTSPRPLGIVRARITTDVVGGTIDVWLLAQG